MSEQLQLFITLPTEEEVKRMHYFEREMEPSDIEGLVALIEEIDEHFFDGKLRENEEFRNMARYFLFGVFPYKEQNNERC